MPSLASENLFLVLASGSPRRRELIELLGLPFTVIIPKHSAANGEERHEVDETPLPGEAPSELVQRLSRVKAESVLAALPSLLSANNTPQRSPIIVAADTIVVLAGRILGKPKDAREARHMLQRLRRQSHIVYTGYTVAVPSQSRAALPNLSPPDRDLFITRLHRSRVWMRPYTDTEIDAYIAGGSPLDKAGAYGIQDNAFSPVARLDGCFASVMGLPIGDVAATLSEVGISLPAVGPRCVRFTGVACCQSSGEFL